MTNRPPSSTPKQVLIYAEATGEEPFTKWLNNLRDTVGRKRILVRLRRIETGNWGDCKFLDDGIFELRLHFGPGYRIYFGEINFTVVLLLCGGDKSSQGKDIAIAKAYWRDYCKNAESKNNR